MTLYSNSLNLLAYNTIHISVKSNVYFILIMQRRLFLLHICICFNVLSLSYALPLRLCHESHIQGEFHITSPIECQPEPTATIRNYSVIVHPPAQSIFLFADYRWRHDINKWTDSKKQYNCTIRIIIMVLKLQDCYQMNITSQECKAEISKAWLENLNPEEV